MKTYVSSYSLGRGEFHYVLTKSNMFRELHPKDYSNDFYPSLHTANKAFDAFELCDAEFVPLKNKIHLIKLWQKPAQRFLKNNPEIML
jgi:hypothetical protein